MKTLTKERVVTLNNGVNQVLCCSQHQVKHRQFVLLSECQPSRKRETTQATVFSTLHFWMTTVFNSGEIGGENGSLGRLAFPGTG